MTPVVQCQKENGQWHYNFNAEHAYCQIRHAHFVLIRTGRPPNRCGSLNWQKHMGVGGEYSHQAHIDEKQIEQVCFNNRCSIVAASGRKGQVN